jgi:hypothetical protein
MEKLLKLGLAIVVANLNYVSFPVRQGNKRRSQ